MDHKILSLKQSAKLSLSRQDNKKAGRSHKIITHHFSRPNDAWIGNVGGKAGQYLFRGNAKRLLPDSILGFAESMLSREHASLYVFACKNCTYISLASRIGCSRRTHWRLLRSSTTKQSSLHTPES